MIPKILLLLLLLKLAASIDDKFIFNGFRGAHLSLDGTATITPEGLLRLTNTTTLRESRAFYSSPIQFKRTPTGDVSSFSSTFVFGIIPEFSAFSGHGIAFVISPSPDIPGAIGSQYMGLFNTSDLGSPSNHIVAVELDTVQNPEFGDIDNNHVGIDINSMRSDKSYRAGYYTDTKGGFANLSLVSGDPMQVWVEYDGAAMQLNVTLSPIQVSEPPLPLLSVNINLSDIIFEYMYVGFSSSSETFMSSHYIMGWSFNVGGLSQPLNISQLPSIPRSIITRQRRWRALPIWLSTSLTVTASGVIAGAVFMWRRRRKRKFSEVLEDWELEYGPHRFSYRDLFEATKGFRDKELLGSGGFGRVYKGVLPTTKAEVAVKKVVHGSRQGMKEFVAEIVSIGRLHHRNLVRLLGYCRRQGELLLVYDFMPNGSLDKLLFGGQASPALDWGRRFRIIKGVASGLVYLHEEWEQVVVHRDIKASNVLLDRELNGRLGDFGLARLYEHGSDPQTTHIVGTMGYLAPELTKTGKVNKATDIFAFGIFLLEVACGRRPVEPYAPEEEVVLVDWVLAGWSRGAEFLEVTDPKLGGCFVRQEMELVLKLGLLCCDPLPAARPNMRQVMQYLDGDLPLPEFSSNYLNTGVMALLHNEAFDEQQIMAYPFTSSSVSPLTVSVAY